MDLTAPTGDAPASWLGFPIPAERGDTWPGVATAVLRKLAAIPRNPNAEPLGPFDHATPAADGCSETNTNILSPSTPKHEELLALPPNHPVLAQAQQELGRQLRATLLTLQRELRCMTKERQTAVGNREQQGLQLYHHQQHLARMQQQMAATDAACQAAVRDRSAAEEQAEAMQRDVDAMAAGCARDALQVAALEAQSQRLATTALQLAAEVDTASSHVAVTRRYRWFCDSTRLTAVDALCSRSTYAADAAASQLERTKRRQDLLLVALQGRKETLEAALSDIDAQVAARGAAAEAARSMLSSTQVGWRWCNCGRIT